MLDCSGEPLLEETRMAVPLKLVQGCDQALSKDVGLMWLFEPQYVYASHHSCMSFMCAKIHALVSLQVHVHVFKTSLFM